MPMFYTVKTFKSNLNIYSLCLKLMFLLPNYDNPLDYNTLFIVHLKHSVSYVICQYVLNNIR